MPSILRDRLALFALVGAFLIPIAMSSLRGLTHVLTCQDQAETPFTLLIQPNGDPLITTSSRIKRGEKIGFCGGLTLNMGARVLESGQIAMILPITNTSEFLWRGTVKLTLGNTSIPVDIGEIPAGQTEQDIVELSLDEGTHALNGSLLIGP